LLPRRAAIALLALAAATLLVACDYNTNSHPAWEDFSGTWNAQIMTSTGSSFPVTLMITQDRGALWGTFTNGGAIHGTLAGSVARDVATFTVMQDPPCPGTFQGDVRLVAPDSFEGTYSGNGCTGPLDATITATR